MSKFFTTSDTITKQFDDDHTITFKKLSYGENQRVMSKCMRMDPRSQEANVDLALYTLERLKARLISWSGPEFEGFPCTPENIEKLEPEIANTLGELMGDATEELTDDEKKA